MSGNELADGYFEWMYQLVYDRRYCKHRSYRKLTKCLHNTDFTYLVPLDGNRFDDGIELRYRFGRKNGFEDVTIATCLDDRPCSVLEMMVALAVRCEEHIMADPDIGNRTGEWFWQMVATLGLAGMFDSAFNQSYTNDVLRRFLNREYAPDGKGGLFAIENCPHDLRNIEIWYQMNWYLNKYI